MEKPHPQGKHVVWARLDAKDELSSVPTPFLTKQGADDFMAILKEKGFTGIRYQHIDGSMPDFAGAVRKSNPRSRSRR